MTTTANGCLKIVNQQGQTTNLPPAPPDGDDWTVETALDVDMVSAVCPSCKILVVQGTNSLNQYLYPAQRTAVTSMVEEYMYIESYLLGAAQGTFDAIGVPVRTEVVLEDRFTGKHILSW